MSPSYRTPIRFRLVFLWTALAVLLAGCATFQPAPETPSVPEAPAAVDRTRAAALHREGLRALNPPRGSAPDPVRAAQLIEQAAILGDPDAQLLLAGGYLFRNDGGRDPRAALPWLQRAAQQGQPEAQFQLARLIETGDGTTREPAWAAVWFHRAAERGVAQAQFAFAMLQIVGVGTAQDQPESLARLTIAEQRGVAVARRYRDALAPRVAPAQAADALARIRSETARGPVVMPDRPAVRFAQSALVALGAAPAGRAVDGRDGAATRAALIAFARQEGLREAAPYDGVVLDRLRARLQRP